MTKETIGHMSGALVLLSAVPYAIRVYRREITAAFTSWWLWSFIGLSILLTYRSSGAQSNVWPAVFGFTNPCIIGIIAYWRNGERHRLDWVEKTCVVLSLFALTAWWFVHNDKSLVQFALYLSIVADACAAGPTIRLAWEHPMEDRPFMWLCFAMGYGLAILAVPDHTVANLLLPTYMCLGPSVVVAPLIRVRLRNRVPMREWV